MSTEFSEKSSREIKADIDQTRQDMDQTIDALADRFQSRHLVDEVVGYFRSGASEVSDRAIEIKDQLADTAGRAAKSVVDTVKRHPVPTALIGAGLAWIIYERLKGSSDNRVPHYRRDRENRNHVGYESADTDYAIDVADESSRFSGKEGQAKSLANSIGNQVRERAQQFREKAEEVSFQVQESTRHAYERSRDQIVDTVQARPVEVGLGLLALGVLVGLALPTSDRVNEAVGPRVDRLRERAKGLGKQLVERGKHVATAAAEAARREAHIQGFTPAGKNEKGSGSTLDLDSGAIDQVDGPAGFASNSSPAQASSDGLPTSNAAEI